LQAEKPFAAQITRHLKIAFTAFYPGAFELRPSLKNK
jgi:hypothetical protein